MVAMLLTGGHDNRSVLMMLACIVNVHVVKWTHLFVNEDIKITPLWSYIDQSVTLQNRTLILKNYPLGTTVMTIW